MLSCHMMMTRALAPSLARSILQIAGNLRLKQQLFDLTFEIGPLSFFQTNILACEVLYTKALDLLNPAPGSLLLDVCCGTGTIGMCASRKFRDLQVVGIDIVEQAIENAKSNCVLNGIDSASYIAGRAENVLPPLIDALTEVMKAKNQNGDTRTSPIQTAPPTAATAAFPEIQQIADRMLTLQSGAAAAAAAPRELCALVDPPRSGLHSTVLAALKSCPLLDRLLYISCNPDSLAENLAMLCHPRKGLSFHEIHTLKIEPFVPVKAIPVDMFPYTYHCEVVILLERLSVFEKRGLIFTDNGPAAASSLQAGALESENASIPEQSTQTGAPNVVTDTS